MYGIDLDDPDRAVLRRRTWRWLEARIIGLLSTDCRLQRVLYPPDEPEPDLGSLMRRR